MKLPYTTDAGVGSRARLGLLVLQADETIEDECRRLVVGIPGVSLNVARIPSGPEVTEETLAAMREQIGSATRLLPEVSFDAIGYACTSASSLLGPDTVAQEIRSARPFGTPSSFEHTCVTNPLTALLAACSVLGVHKLGFVSPYIASVSKILRRAIEAGGCAIAGFGSFEQSEEKVVARITQASIHDAALQVGRAEPCDAVFISCTNARTFDVIEQAETDLGLPVLSSNQVLMWHMLRIAGIKDAVNGLGQIFKRPLGSDPSIAVATTM